MFTSIIPKNKREVLQEDIKCIKSTIEIMERINLEDELENLPNLLVELTSKLVEENNYKNKNELLNKLRKSITILYEAKITLNINNERNQKTYEYMVDLHKLLEEVEELLNA